MCAQDDHPPYTVSRDVPTANPPVPTMVVHPGDLTGRDTLRAPLAPGAEPPVEAKDASVVIIIRVHLGRVEVELPMSVTIPAAMLGRLATDDFIKESFGHVLRQAVELTLAQKQ